jgi:serine/threonine protein kinase
METSSFGSEWGGRVVEGKFPLLEWLGGSGNCSSFFTVLGGMHEAVIQILFASDVAADAYLAQWNFAINLSHPHLSKILASGQSVIDNRELVYVVTDHSDGSLSKIIRNEALQAARIREIFNPVLSALAYLHKNGVVHGHINPSNIQFAGSTPKLSVADLLIAGPVRRSVANPGPYDAPELQHDTVTAAADTWAVAMTMYEAMTQAPVALDSAEKAQEHARLVQSLPRPFLEILQDCLEIDPLRRCTIDSIRERINETEQISLSDTRIPVEIENATGAQAPIPVRDLAEEPDEVSSVPDAFSTEEADVSQPVLFSKSFERFEEAHLKRFRVMPYAVVVLGVIALITVLLVRRHKTGRLQAVESAKTAATTAESVPQKQPAAPEVEASVPERQSIAPASAVGPPVEPQSNPTVAEKLPQEIHQPETPSAPHPDQPSPKISLAGNHAQPQGETNGAVVKRVLPNVSPGAFEGMRTVVEVQARVSVNKAGKVSDVAYVSPGPGNYFARLAQRASRSWEFTPPTQNGEPERSVWKLQFYFARNKTEATAIREQK